MDPTAAPLAAPEVGDDWLGLSATALPDTAAAAWVARPDCGAVVVFTGTVRDASAGRPGVTGLHYEAYEEVIGPQLMALAVEARTRWPVIGRLVCLHRVGDLAVGESAVVVAVSSAHRDTAFDAARWCIDTLKATLPIWKQEHWAGGRHWGDSAPGIEEVAS